MYPGGPRVIRKNCAGPCLQFFCGHPERECPAKHGTGGQQLQVIIHLITQTSDSAGIRQIDKLMYIPFPNDATQKNTFCSLHV